MDPFSLLIGGTMLAGSFMSGFGSLLGGKAARAGADMKASALEQGGILSEQEAGFQAQQLTMAAAESRAASQREAFEKRHNAKLALSTLIARAAAGGGGVSDPTVVKIGERIAERGEYQALMDMFTGENRARGLEDQAYATRWSGAARNYGAQLDAQATRYSGKAEEKASYFKAGGTILSGIGSAAYMAAPATGRYR